MNQQHVLEWRWRRFDNLSRFQRAFGQQPVAHEFEFANGEDVALADVGVVERCVKDLHARVVRILKDF
jgi:hypothetical protein